MAEAVARAEAELGPLRLALNVAGRLDRQHCLNVGRDRQPRADAGALQRLRGRRDPHAQIDGDGLGGSRDQGQFDLAGLYRDADEHAAGDGCCGVQRVEAQPTETQWINVRAKPMWSRLADSQTRRQVIIAWAEWSSGPTARKQTAKS